MKLEYSMDYFEVQKDVRSEEEMMFLRKQDGELLHYATTLPKN